MAIVSRTTEQKEPQRYRWTSEAYCRLAETGFFGEDQDVELIGGDLLLREPPGPFHAGTVNPVAEILKAAFGDGFVVRTEQPLVTGGTSTPQPDIVVCIGTNADFRRRFPSAEEVRLIVEVADTTLATDRTVKLADYAAAAIPEYWILNLDDLRLEVYRAPQGREYQSVSRHLPGDIVHPLHAPQANIAVSELLGL